VACGTDRLSYTDIAGGGVNVGLATDALRGCELVP